MILHDITRNNDLFVQICGGCCNWEILALRVCVFECQLQVFPLMLQRECCGVTMPLHAWTLQQHCDMLLPVYIQSSTDTASNFKELNSSFLHPGGCMQRQKFACLQPVTVPWHVHRVVSDENRNRYRLANEEYLHCKHWCCDCPKTRDLDTMSMLIQCLLHQPDCGIDDVYHSQISDRHMKNAQYWCFE